MLEGTVPCPPPAAAAPAIVGGGKRALPDAVRLDLDLLDQRRFADGMVFLRYSVAGVLA